MESNCKNFLIRKTLKPMIFVIGIALLMFFTNACSGPSGEGKALESGFVKPPDDAKPRVWWHWMNGNVTKRGIRADLEWMKRTGIGGFQNFDAGMTTPQVVTTRLIYMTPEWKDAFRFTAELADSLGLEMAIAGSPGWSESGGPWVKPEEAMKKFVWSETPVEGGKPFSGKLPEPPSVSGPFQNVGLERRSRDGEEAAPSPHFYKDAAVIAFRLPEDDQSMASLQPAVSSSGGKFTLEELSDGDVVTSSLLPAAPAGQSSWIEYAFDEPVTVQAISIAGSGGSSRSFMGGGQNTRTLQASDDGKEFHTVADLPSGSVQQRTLSFKPVTAKYFRVAWLTPPAQNESQPAFSGMGAGRAPQGPAGTNVSELVLYTSGHVNRFEEKAAFAAATDLYTAFTLPVTDADVVSKADVIDLTSQMGPDGQLDWTPPEGKWMVMRLGYSLTGHTNGPASPEATGLEVDKLSATHVKSYFTNYLDQYKDATGGLMGARGLQYVITDSWEAGTQNWTDDMITEFKNRRGYDMVPWLPVLSGHIVESAEASDKFLWDFRKTLGDLVTENHYDLLTTMLKERGMGRYSESHEARRAFIGDGMEAKRTADVPMGAGWTPGGFGGNEGDFATVYQADIRESASVSHLYGQKYVAAESLTAMGTDWAWSPELLKPVADYLMACGLNRFVIHTSVHQPLMDSVPGLSLGQFGQWFTRNETWADEAIAWTTYLSRSCFMLQQGKFVADVAYYYGEDNNITVMFNRSRGSGLPPIPEGYNYDFINADALAHLLSVKNGELVTPSGMSYRLLALDPNSEYMTLEVLDRIRALVEAGAVVCGPKPVMDPSLSDDPAEFDRIVNQLWADEQGENIIGKGKIYAGYSMKDALEAMNIGPDFTYSKPEDNTRIFYLHRRVKDVDIYWVNNRSDRVEDIVATFRVKGMAPEIWHPETGLISPASYTIADGVTEVPMHLQPEDAVFVVFREKAKTAERTIPVPVDETLETVEGPWTVKFQEKRGAPDELVFDQLTPWNENENMGVKYFSGTASYLRTLDVPESWLSDDAELWIDLGEVKDLAEVFVNGESLGIVWKTPFRVDATRALKPGENTLDIRVTDLWVNRLIGDRQPDAKEQITFTTSRPYRADSPLRVSGLLGPVTIVSEKSVD